MIPSNRVDSARNAAPVNALASVSPPRAVSAKENPSASKAPPSRHSVSFRRSAIHGRGVFARRDIPEGTAILEYTGERITKREALRREAQRLERQRRGGDDAVYIFVLNRRHDLDGRRSRSIARFINHSCAPNCRSEIRRGRVWIVACRDLVAGEELTFDYGFGISEWRLHPCRCGSPRCAGFIVGSGQRWRLRRIPRAERNRCRAASPTVPDRPERAGKTRSPCA